MRRQFGGCRRYTGGSCPNIACTLSKNEIAHLAQFGTTTAV